MSSLQHFASLVEKALRKSGKPSRRRKVDRNRYQMEAMDPIRFADQGLLAYFFYDENFTDFAGSAVVTSLDFDWTTNPPLPGMSNTNFSVRIIGDFSADAKGTLDITVHTTGSFSVSIGDPAASSTLIPVQFSGPPSPPPAGAGDMNGDGIVDGDDIGAFWTAYSLQDQQAFDQAYPYDANFPYNYNYWAADFNQDGSIDDNDAALLNIVTSDSPPDYTAYHGSFDFGSTEGGFELDLSFHGGSASASFSTSSTGGPISTLTFSHFTPPALNNLPANLQATEGQPLSSFQVATFTDPAAIYPAGQANLTAYIRWGDGSTGPAQVHYDAPTSGEPRSGTITASPHTFAHAGSYTAQLIVSAGQDRMAISTFPITITPAAPTNLLATPAALGQINLAWTDHSSSESGFNLYLSSDGGNTFDYLNSIPANTTTYAVTGLTGGVSYLFKVAAFGNTGESAPAVSAPVTFFAAPLIDSSADGSGRQTYTLSTGFAVDPWQSFTSPALGNYSFSWTDTFNSGTLSSNDSDGNDITVSMTRTRTLSIISTLASDGSWTYHEISHVTADMSFQPATAGGMGATETDHWTQDYDFAAAGQGSSSTFTFYAEEGGSYSGSQPTADTPNAPLLTWTGSWSHISTILRPFSSVYSDNQSGTATQTTTEILPYIYAIAGGSVTGTQTITEVVTDSSTYSNDHRTDSGTDTTTTTYTGGGSYSDENENGTDFMAGTVQEHGRDVDVVSWTTQSARQSNGSWTTTGSADETDDSEDHSTYDGEGDYIHFIRGGQILGYQDEDGREDDTGHFQTTLTLNASGEWIITSGSGNSSSDTADNYHYGPGIGGYSYTETNGGETDTISGTAREHGQTLSTGHSEVQSTWSNGAWTKTGSGEAKTSSEDHSTYTGGGTYHFSDEFQTINGDLTTKNSSLDITAESTLHSTLQSDGSWAYTSGSGTGTDQSESHTAYTGDGDYSYVPGAGEWIMGDVHEEGHEDITNDGSTTSAWTSGAWLTTGQSVGTDTGADQIDYDGGGIIFIDGPRGVIEAGISETSSSNDNYSTTTQYALLPNGNWAALSASGHETDTKDVSHDISGSASYTTSNSVQTISGTQSVTGHDESHDVTDNILTLDSAGWHTAASRTYHSSSNATFQFNGNGTYGYDPDPVLGVPLSGSVTESGTEHQSTTDQSATMTNAAGVVISKSGTGHAEDDYDYRFHYEGHAGSDSPTGNGYSGAPVDPDDDSDLLPGGGGNGEGGDSGGDVQYSDGVSYDEHGDKHRYGSDLVDWVMDSSGNWIRTHDEQMDNGSTEGGYQYSLLYTTPDGESYKGTQTEKFHLVFSNDLIQDWNDQTHQVDTSGDGHMTGHGEGNSVFKHTNADGTAGPGGVDNYTIDVGWTMDYATGFLTTTAGGRQWGARVPGDSYNYSSPAWGFMGIPVVTGDMNMLPTTYGMDWGLPTTWQQYGLAHPELVTQTMTLTWTTRTPPMPYDPGPVTNPPWVEKTVTAANVVSTICLSLADGYLIYKGVVVVAEKIAAKRAAIALIEAGETKAAAAAVESGATLPEGSFSIRNWSGYPEGVPKPHGPFRLIGGAEYQEARAAANTANRALRQADPAAYAGKQIHEIKPVKFDGSPTDLANKVPLSPQTHSQVTSWWNALMRGIYGG